MPTYFCQYCGKDTNYVNVSEAADLAQVTRTTIYSWMRKHELHCVHRPSGRHFICALSLLVNEEFDGDGTAVQNASRGQPHPPPHPPRH